MWTRESSAVDIATSFDIEIAAAPSGQKLPLVVIVHGNFGLDAPFGNLLRAFTKQLVALGFVSALPTYYASGRGNPMDSDIAGSCPR